MRTLILSAAIVALFHATSSAEPNQQLYDELPPLERLELGPDVLALGTSLELVAGSFELNGAGIANNSVDDETATLALALATRYFRGYETRLFGYSVEANASDSLGRVPGQITNVFDVGALPEFRYYPVHGSLLFVHTALDVGVTVNSVMDTNADTSDSTAPGRIAIGAGVGFGRVLSVDPIVRVRRLERALTEEGLLSGPITPEVGTQIIGDWYALRNDFGDYRRLAYAMKDLQSAGLLAGDVGLRASYKARAVIADPFIFERRRGWDARAGIGRLHRFTGYSDAPDPDPSMAFLGSAQYELPIDTERQLSLLGKMSVDLGGTGPMDPARPWNARGFATYSQVFYGPYYDPTGAIELSGSAGITGFRFPDGSINTPKTGLDVSGSIAYSRALNRGSLATTGVTASLFNDGTFLLGIRVGITWGVASGFYTPYSAM